MESIWQKYTNIQQRAETKRFTGTHQTRAAVIGAGMSGIVTAFLLKEAGVETVVLEAGTAAGGQTGYTTAKITSQHGMIYHHLLETVGNEKARQYARANEAAVREYGRLVREYEIECEYRRCTSYLYAKDGEGAEKRIRKLKQETEAARRLGIQAEFTNATELPFSVAGAEVFPNQAQFHPLKFIKGLEKRLDIYEYSQVIGIRDNCIFTREGLLEADVIIFACHFPWMIAPGYYFLRMHQERSYVLALSGAKALEGMYRDMDTGGLSLRSSQEVLLLGGSGHPVGKQKRKQGYHALEEQGRTLYPNSRVNARWSAQDCVTLDGIPYIGYFSRGIPNWYIATGFGKWGMTGAMTSAMIIRDMVLGMENENEDVFSPQRINWRASAPGLIQNMGTAAKSFSKRLLQFPARAAKDVSCGEGKIVEYQGKKAGVYRDMEGKIYAVNIKCQHMGCQLAWNPQELTWDCPCHGSRYDYQGKLLDGPAQKPLTCTEEESPL